MASDSLASPPVHSEARMPVVRPGDEAFGEHSFVVTRNLLDDFRTKLLAEIEQDAGDFHPLDTKKIREDDDLCRRYIRQKKLDLAAALAYAKHSLRWRKEIGIYDITESSLPEDFYRRGVVVPYNVDKTGSHLVTLRVKHHTRDSSRVGEMRKFLVYFLEKILNEHGALRVSVLFDCTDAAISNFDMELVKFVVALFKEYYPWALGYILIYNMPWIFNAAWKIVKTMIPSEGVQRIKFTSREDIFDYVDGEKLPEYMGGKDTYVYEYVKGKPLGERCPVVAYPPVAIP